MECLCGYKHGYFNVDSSGEGLKCVHINGEFGEFREITIHTSVEGQGCDINIDRSSNDYRYGTLPTNLYACPKCGTVKVSL